MTASMCDCVARFKPRTDDLADSRQPPAPLWRIQETEPGWYAVVDGRGIRATACLCCRHEAERLLALIET